MSGRLELASAHFYAATPKRRTCMGGRAHVQRHKDSTHAKQNCIRAHALFMLKAMDGRENGNERIEDTNPGLLSRSSLQVIRRLRANNVRDIGDLETGNVGRSPDTYCCSDNQNVMDQELLRKSTSCSAGTPCIANLKNNIIALENETWCCR